MMKAWKTASLLAAGTLVIAVAGCERHQDSAQGPAEKAGQQLDQAAAKAGEELNKAALEAGKGLQQLGEKLQDQAQNAQKKDQ
jgi:hypothetical protein